MYYGLVIVNGMLLAITIALNGLLSDGYGSNASLVFIHALGLAAIVIVMIFRHEKFTTQKKLPLWMYLAGLPGVVGTLFYNLTFTFGAISVSAMMALALISQSITSIAVDKFGLCGMKKRKFNKKKLIGLAIATLGVVVMFVV